MDKTKNLILQNPFLYRRETTLGSPEIRNPNLATAKKHIGRSGRSNSAPDSYNWAQNRQKSIETNLEVVKEVSLDPNGEEVTTTFTRMSRSRPSIRKSLSSKKCGEETTTLHSNEDSSEDKTLPNCDVRPNETKSIKGEFCPQTSQAR